MSRLLLLLGVCIIWIRSDAQISIMLSPPNPLQAKASDLFRSGLTNATGQPVRLYLVGTVIDRSSGQQVVGAKTAVLDYPVGYKQLNEGTLYPAYTYNSNSAQQTGYLPYGNYQFCLRAYSEVQHEELGYGCVDVEVTPTTPPLLFSPDNTAEIPTAYPLLVWIPPTPVNPALRILYDLKLAEVMQNQTSYDAIQRNLALFEQRNISATNLQYPGNAMKLEIGKTYAWRILAKSGEGNVIGETEVWTFRLIDPARPDSSAFEKEVVISSNYIKLESRADGGYVNAKNQLKLIYEERYGKASLEIVVKDAANKEVYRITKNIQAGDNRFTLDLGEMSLKANSFYRVEALAQDRPARYLLFKNIK